ncbi:tyrosine-type recombinase/integrase [Mesorhizobium sp. IMUNJ 23232]|uniref:tyrosine-type recombinase/integrase n=1 Tax=Mesorhizobium sp. IMUNJ 23232 TaxID=3376064 RepID=UPI0037A446C2
MTFLVTSRGKPFTESGFTNWFRDMVKEADLSLHGLRKTACVRLADAGRSVTDITAISSHRNLAEVQTHVRPRTANARLWRRSDLSLIWSRRTKSEQTLSNR